MPDTPPRAMGFLLIDGFSLMSFASVVEPLRAANVLGGRQLYAWANISMGGEPVAASSGLTIQPDRSIADGIAFDSVFVCAAGNPTTFADRPTFTWLRRLARAGVRIAGVSGGPYILARAGLLDGYRSTIHWEHVPAFIEAFPQLDMTRALFEIDRGRLTCGGGVAALDMMHAMITADHGPVLAAAVSDWFLQTDIRAEGDVQRLAPRERYGTANVRLLTALRLMEARLDEPVDRRTLAEAAGVTLRQLERLFAQYLSTSIGRHYLRLRLDRARVLLRQTGMPVVEAGIASGFASPSHFSKCYKAQFGLSPKDERRPQ